MKNPLDLTVVDTSVFIDFFRGHSSEHFELLVSHNRVILSQIVKLEILKGARKKEVQIIGDLLSGLRNKTSFPDPKLCLHLINKAQGSGLLGGIPDLLIIADAIETKARIMSNDKNMKILAKKLGIVVL